MANQNITIESNIAFLTVDVETDWGGRSQVTHDGLYGIREALPKIVDILKKRSSKATFFVSAVLAEKEKDIVPWLIEEGHEVASHGYEHCSYAGLSRKDLDYQLAKSRDILQEQSNIPILGFRSPQFSISPYMFSSLKEAGYLYDSSVVLGRLAGRYKNYSEHLCSAKKNEITEFAVSTLPLINIPFGLLWANVIGTTIVRLLLKYQSAMPQHYGPMLYLHPFDILEKKQLGAGMPLVARAWYSFSGKSASSTLNDIVEYLDENYRITMLREKI